MFLEFNMEPEEIAAWYEIYKNENDIQFKLNIHNLRKSHSNVVIPNLEDYDQSY